MTDVDLLGPQGRARILLRHLRWKISGFLAKRSLSQYPGNDFVAYYSTDMGQLLATLCDRHGSDKGSIGSVSRAYPWRPHTYADYYDRLLRGRRKHVRLVFECGVGTTRMDISSTMGEAGRPGASLRVWRDYFPTAEIYGADIDPNVLFEDDRIRCFHMDQTDATSIARFWASVNRDGFDLIIDDGLHEFTAGICLFENSIDRLDADGTYVIEDVNWTDLVRYRNYFAQSKYLADFIVLESRGPARNDNNLVVVRKRTEQPPPR